MVDLSKYTFKILNTDTITSAEYFTYAYVKGVYESEHVRTATKQLREILYDKYEKAKLHEVMETQCQHLTMTQRNESLKMLQQFE